MTNRSRYRLPLGALAFSLALAGVHPAPPAEAAPEAAPAAARSLYLRLGGYDAIAAVTDDFIGRLAGDAQLGKFFAGHSTDSLKRIRQLVVDEVCAATGGPCVYTGRDPKTAHAGLGITEADWTASVNHFLATLDKLKVPPKEKDELVAIVASLKADIVTAAPAAPARK